MSGISQLSKNQIDLYDHIYSALKSSMEKYYQANKDKTFTVLLSGGYDSRFVLYMCKELGIPIKRCYTFSLDNKLSTDARLAKEVCEQENVDLQIVRIPTDSVSVIQIMEELARDYGCVKKTDFECGLPIYCLWENVEEDVILMATDADNYFGLDKKFAIHYKDLPDGLTKYKEYLWSDPNSGQVKQKAQLDKNYGKQMFDVFNSHEAHEAFKGTTWEELNKPHKKGVLYYKFADRYDAIKPYHSNYQCGDSGIRELCADVLLHSDYNPRGKYISVTGCYNEIRRRAHAPKKHTLL